MLPKIDQKPTRKPDSFYPKIKTYPSGKENNISRLKMLREFLENKSIQIDKKQSQRYSQNLAVNSSIEYINISNMITPDLSLQESDRAKANTSEVSRKKKKILPQLEMLERWSMDRM